MKLTFRENSLWFALIALTLMFVKTFISLIIPDFSNSDILFFYNIFFVITLPMLAYIIIFSLRNPKEANQKSDERNVIIENKSYKYSYIVLIVSHFHINLNIFLHKPTSTIAPILFLYFTFSIIIMISMKLFYYHKGV